MINATVSHEMRNPLNSIYSQNVNNKQINEKMMKFIAIEMDHLPIEEIKSRLKSFSEEYLESAKIQTSSTKLLTYLVNDILDLSQINSGKFRIDSSVFNICEAIDEIISIQKQKAELSDVALNYEIQGFDLNLLICSDS